MRSRIVIQTFDTTARNQPDWASPTGRLTCRVHPVHPFTVGGGNLKTIGRLSSRTFPNGLAIGKPYTVPELDRRTALQLLSGGALGAALMPVAGASSAAALPLGVSAAAAGIESGLPSGPGRFRAEAACRAAIRRVPRGPHVSFGVGVHDAVSGRRFIHDPSGAWEMASTVKIDLLLATLRRAQLADRSLTDHERALARSMIVSSSNQAASRVWAANGGAEGMMRLWRRIGLDDMRPGTRGRWGLTRTSVRSRLRMLGILVDGHPAIDVKRANEILGLMRQTAADQRWGVGGARRRGELAEIKNGWLPRSTHDRRWIINTTGRVHARKPSAPGGRVDLRMVVLSRGHASMHTGVVHTEQVLQTARRTLGV